MISQKPLTKRDFAVALSVFASLGLAGCGIVDDLSDTGHAMAGRWADSAPKSKVCKEVRTMHFEPDTAWSDTVTRCEVSK